MNKNANTNSAISILSRVDIHSEPITSRTQPTSTTYYFTGHPCIHGHVTYRYTNSGVCVGCAIIQGLGLDKKLSIYSAHRLHTKQKINKPRRAIDTIFDKDPSDIATSIKHAIETNQRFFVGMYCPRHHTNIRYIRDVNRKRHSCPKCFGESSDRVAAKRRGEVVLNLTLTKYPHKREREMVNRCHQRAKLKGLEFNLNAEYIHSIFPSDDRCPVLGLVFKRGVGRQIDESPSIDRIDSNGGYTIGNVQVISAKANRIKNNGSVDDVSKVLRYMQTCCIFV